MRNFTMTAAAALIVGTAASAQMFGDEIGTDYDYDRFSEGFAATGSYEALDRDGDALLNENEYATGLFADYDRDRDMMIGAEEYDLANRRYYGDTFEGGGIERYDANADGMLDRQEFRQFYRTEAAPMYADYDRDADGFLNADEYGSKIYERADANQDRVITVDEEEWFEGWFDGDDITTRVREVGDVL